MYIKDSDIRERLLEAGKQEFLQYGFQQASLRRICAKAGVTTGAVYSCFENKEDLFCSIVGGTVNELKRIMHQCYEAECRNDSLSVDNDVQSMTFCWHNRDVVMLLLEGAEGTRYADTLPQLENMMREMFSGFFRQHTGTDIDPDLVHILAKTSLRNYVEILKGGYSLERSLELAEMLSLHSNTGFRMLMQIAQQEKIQPEG